MYNDKAADKRRGNQKEEFVVDNNEVSGAKLKVLNRDIIKFIAMITMLLNHLATVLLIPGVVLQETFEYVGYFTAPVMCYFLVEGYDYTRSKRQYGLRLFLCAILSQIPFRLALPFGNLNMLYTLFCCFLILVVLDRVANPMPRLVICCLLVLATAVGDWPLLAPLYTIFFYCSKGSRKKTAVSFLAAYLLFVSFMMLDYMLIVQGTWTVSGILHELLSGVAILAAGVTVLFFYSGKRAEKGKNFFKWFFYIFYPAHLMILYLIKVYMIYV